MQEEFGFVTSTGQHIEEQQALVRKIVGDAFDLPSYRWKIGT